jgi:hypothetical protein
LNWLEIFYYIIVPTGGFIGLIFFILYLLFVRYSREARVGDEVPIGNISYKDRIMIYRRVDGFYYQRLGPIFQRKVARMQDGTIHASGPYLDLDENELVEIVEIRE